jgi:hypothetical protein
MNTKLFERAGLRYSNFLSAVLVIGVVALHPANAEDFIKVGAHVDGRDQLIIQGNTYQWHHFDYAAVGRSYGSNTPTVLEVPEGRGLWTPNWPEPVPAEIRHEAYSSALSGFGHPLPSSATRWHVEKFAGLGSVHVVAQPSAANQYKLVVEFNDNPIGGPSFYWVRLSPVKQVVMDVRPWARSNTVAPTNPTIRVAIMSDLMPSGFVATQLDAASVRFGPSGAAPVDHNAVDLNADGHLDLILTFPMEQTGISCGDAEVELTATTVSGEAIEARDILRTVGCK